MTHSQQISLLNKIALYSIFFILGAIVFSQCNSRDVTKPISYNELGNKIKLLYQKSKQLAHKKDSLQSIKLPLIARYIQVHKEVLINIHDTVSVLKFVYKCDSVISLDSSLIVNCYDTVSNRDSIISAKDQQLSEKSDSLKTAIKSNKKYFKGLCHGLVAGVILVESANIYSKFKP